MDPDAFGSWCLAQTGRQALRRRRAPAGAAAISLPRAPFIAGKSLTSTRSCSFFTTLCVGTCGNRYPCHALILRCILSDYLTRVGDRVCHTVGAYEIEGRGIQLFDRVEGDTFTIIGLPLLPLLAELRARGAIAHEPESTGVHHRLAGRPFALAADPRLLAEEIRHRRHLHQAPGAARGCRGFLRTCAIRAWPAAT